MGRTLYLDVTRLLSGDNRVAINIGSSLLLGLDKPEMDATTSCLLHIGFLRIALT